MKVAWMVVMAALAGLGQDSKSALESDPSGWVDVFPGKDFKGWKRLPLDPGAPLATKAVWSHSEDGKMLRCDGTGGVKELLLNDEERGDGIFHVEWRWGKDQGEKPTYNGGIYLRSSEDGRTWIQAQVARGPKPPVVGDFIGMLMEDGKPKRTDLRRRARAARRRSASGTPTKSRARGRPSRSG
jgi:hypothetical protein